MGKLGGADSLGTFPWAEQLPALVVKYQGLGERTGPWSPVVRGSRRGSDWLCRTSHV